jgi:hypothetical protein
MTRSRMNSGEKSRSRRRKSNRRKIDDYMTCVCTLLNSCVGWIEVSSTSLCTKYAINFVSMIWVRH